MASEGQDRSDKASSHGTTTVFRCQGWVQHTSSQDNWGLHDLVWLLVFGAVGVAWYYMVFESQRDRNAMLNGRAEVLKAQLKAEQIELVRLEREIQALQRNDPAAWERAARMKLRWLEPGEWVDIKAWRREEVNAGRPDPLLEHEPRQPNRRSRQSVRPVPQDLYRRLQDPNSGSPPYRGPSILYSARRGVGQSSAQSESYNSDANQAGRPRQQVLLQHDW